MLLHSLGKKKFKFSADVEENAKKCIFNRPQLCYLSTNFDIFVV